MVSVNTQSYIHMLVCLEGLMLPFLIISGGPFYSKWIVKMTLLDNSDFRPKFMKLLVS